MRIDHNMMPTSDHKPLGDNISVEVKRPGVLTDDLVIDYVADLAIDVSVYEKMRTQIVNLDQILTNAENGIFFLQTDDGTLGEVRNILVRMQELITLRSNGADSTNHQNNINLELAELQGELKNIISTTEFNGKSIDGRRFDIFSDCSKLVSTGILQKDTNVPTVTPPVPQKTETMPSTLTNQVSPEALTDATVSAYTAIHAKDTGTQNFIINGQTLTIDSTDDERAMNIKLHNLMGCEDIDAKFSGSKVTFTSARVFTTGNGVTTANATATEYSTTAISKPVAGEIMTVTLGMHSFDLISTSTPSDIINAMTAAGIPASVFACVLNATEIIFRSTNKFKYTVSTKADPATSASADPTFNLGIVAVVLLLSLLIAIVLKLL